MYLMTLKIDPIGRVTVPKAIRDELKIGPGDLVQVEISIPKKGGLPSSAGERMRSVIKGV